MRSSIRLLLPALLLSLAACESSPGAKSPESKPHPLVGKRAPAVEGTAVPGSKQATLKYPGDVVVVDFWATYCGPCVKEFPRLQAMADRFNGKVHVVAVSEDEDADLVPPFLTRTGVKFPVTWDKDKAIGNSYSVDSMPQTFVVDGKGVVRFVHRGYHAGEADELEQQVKALLAE